MLEKLLLAITVTFSVYLSAQDYQLSTTPTFSVGQHQPIFNAIVHQDSDSRIQESEVTSQE
jgi:hypothetical protein